MKSWYRTIREDELKDGSIRKVYHLVFETDDKSIVEKVEQFFCDIMDGKEGECWELDKINATKCAE